MTPDNVMISDPLAFLSGGGEMGLRTREFDWSRTTLGPAESWAQSLKTAVSIMLGCRHPLLIWWGPELLHFYNDAYIPVLGKRHPTALGRPAPEVWSEAWPTVGPQAEAVMNDGRSHWNEEMLIVMTRNGYPEEVYMTFSHGPILDDNGRIGGVFCACTEETQRVLDRRRLRTLRALADRSYQAKTAEEACQTAAAELANNANDLPFALVYLLDEKGRRATLAGSGRFDFDSHARPEVIDIEDRDHPWRFHKVAETRKAFYLDHLEEAFGALPVGPWPEPTQTAVILPMTRPGQDRLAGFFVAGLNPRLPLDENYKGFLHLVAGQIATAVSNARAYVGERKRVEDLGAAPITSVALGISEKAESSRVLVVDDDADMLDYLRRLLSVRYQVYTATNGEEALVTALRELPELVLADVLMPKLDGIGLLKALRTNETTRTIPIVLLSGRSEEESKVEGLEAGADDYLIKPFSARELLAHVDSHLQIARIRRGSEQKLRESEIRLKAILEQLPVGVGVHDCNGQFVLSNSIMRQCMPQGTMPSRDHTRIKRWKAVDLKGRPLPPEQWPGTRALRGEAVPGIEFLYTGDEGRVFWINVSSMPLRSADEAIVGAISVAQDITERKKADEALRASEERYRSLVIASSDMVYSMSPDWKKMYRLHGNNLMAHTDSPSTTWLEKYIYPGDQPNITTAIDEAIKTKSIFEHEHRVFRADGSLGWVISRAVPMLDTNGEIVEWVGAASDITGRKEAEEALQRSRDELELRVRKRTAELERRNQELQNFTFAASHDLQEPLRKIQTLINLTTLKCPDSLNEQGREYLGRMNETATRMRGVLDSLLEYTRLTSKLKPSSRIYLNDIAREIVSDLEFKIRDVDASVEIGDLPEIEADAGQMRQLFQNLLENALKFGRKGVQTKVRIRSDIMGDGKCRIYVEDNGIGFDEKYLNRIFRPFQRLHGKNHYDGIGMGLAICAKVVERLGGTITAKSTPGKGSTFVITLPLKQRDNSSSLS